MKKAYYITKEGIIKRKENTIYFINRQERTILPINKIYAIYTINSVTVSSQALKLLSDRGIEIHFLNKFGFYEGSYYPRKHLISGTLLVKQVEHFIDKKERSILAKKFVEGSMKNMLRNLTTYRLQDEYEKIANIGDNLSKVNKIVEIMNIEGRIREIYYNLFDKVTPKNLDFEKRSRRPPLNPLNALMSFGNTLMYSTVLSEIYHTQLNPTISYLHSPSERRFSLALDIAEIFKPIVIDRLILLLVNKKMIQKKHFDESFNYSILNEKGRTIFIQQYDKKLQETIKHRKLNKNISYRRLIRLELYKLIKHLMGAQEYKPFVIWW